MTLKKMLLILILLSVVTMSVLAGCGSASVNSQTAESVDTLPMASMNQMPADVQKAPPVVQKAYQFAFANPQVLKQIPCYCGCASMGHTSNYSCYVKNVSTDEKIEFDPHALGCSICVDITQDVMRMLKEGKSVSNIRFIVDDTYSQYGPSNMPVGQ